MGEIIAHGKSKLNFDQEEVDGGWLYRTKGEPVTAWTALQDFRSDFEDASDRFMIPIPVIVGMMAIEAKKQKADRSHFDPRSVREEPGYISDRKTPHRISPGLMQTLISTAQMMNNQFQIYLDMDFDIEELTREDLFVPARSIMLGTAYMRYQITKEEIQGIAQPVPPDDPVLLVGSYNAGSIKETRKNPYKIMTYGEGRIDKFMAYHNDCIHVMSLM